MPIDGQESRTPLLSFEAVSPGCIKAKRPFIISIGQLLKPTIPQITTPPSEMNYTKVHHFLISNSSIANEAYHTTMNPKVSTKIHAERFPWSPPPISVLLKSSRMLPMTEWTNTIPAYGQRIKIGNLSNYRTTHGTTVISSIQLNNGLLINFESSSWQPQIEVVTPERLPSISSVFSRQRKRPSRNHEEFIESHSQRDDSVSLAHSRRSRDVPLPRHQQNVLVNRGYRCSYCNRRWFQKYYFRRLFLSIL